MKIAVLSGKGGTGKTLVSVNLAVAAINANYIDCDVEEPNGHLFFKPFIDIRQDINVKMPVIDDKLCVGCKECVEFCRFNALAYAGKVIVFENVCHSCGGCAIVCKYNAISEIDKTIGHIEIGNSDGVRVFTGCLNVGEVSGVPIIKSLLEKVLEGDTFIDCPPGSACLVMESIKDADYCIIVAEPTIFGLHNFQMVYELVSLFKKPYGVVLNKCTDLNNPSEKYCIENNINILEKIPFDIELGKINSDAEIVYNKSEKYRLLFNGLLNKIREAIK